MKTSSLLLSILGVTTLAVASPAQALLIDFETTSGYTTGVLSGKPSSGTQWALLNGGTNVVNVTSAVGVGGTQGIAGTGTGAGSNFVYYGFNTTNADIASGYTFNSETSILDYSFQWRPTQAFGTSNSQSIFAFTIGSDSTTGASAALRLDIRSSGRLIALDGATNQAVDGLFTLNTYATISGRVNYATNTYTVFVNNTQQFTSVSGGNLAFNNTDSDNAFIRVGNLGGGTTDYRSWNADNITLVPEPTSAVLLGLGAFGLALLRRRRSMRN